MDTQPSLLAFTLARLDEDEQAVMMNMPIKFDPEWVDSSFEDQFLTRRAMIDRIRLDKAIIAACVEAMTKEQGFPPVPRSDGATGLGSEVVKLIAHRYHEHPDYNEDWQLH